MSPLLENCFKLLPFVSLIVAASLNDFEKDLYKLMNNALFGKTCENLELRRNFKIVTDKEDIKKRVSKPTFKNIIEYDDEFSIIEFAKKNVCYDKPV